MSTAPRFWRFSCSNITSTWNYQRRFSGVSLCSACILAGSLNRKPHSSVVSLREPRKPTRESFLATDPSKSIHPFLNPNSLKQPPVRSRTSARAIRAQFPHQRGLLPHYFLRRSPLGVKRDESTRGPSLKAPRDFGFSGGRRSRVFRFLVVFVFGESLRVRLVALRPCLNQGDQVTR